MEKLLTQLFPEGKRKLVVSLIALAIAVALEKFYGGLSEEMLQAIIAIVAIFVTGNVSEHITSAVKVVKGTKVGQVIEQVIPGDQGLMDEVDDGTGEAIMALQAEIRELRQANEKTNVTLSQLAQVVSNILNRQAGAANVGQGQQGPQRG